MAKDPDPIPMAQVHTRREIRKRYGIRGSLMKDCLVSCLCHGRALTQEGRELELEERGFQ